MDSKHLCECGCGKPMKPELFKHHPEWCGYQTECWIWEGNTNPNGYGLMTGYHKVRLAHRLSWIKHHKRDIPDGMGVLHHCDVPPCVRPDHLFLGTQRDNVRDMIEKGRAYQGHHPWSYKPKPTIRGTRHPKAVLNEDSVREIRARYRSGGVSERGLAAEYGVGRQTITRVLKRTSWAWLPD